MLGHLPLPEVFFFFFSFGEKEKNLHVGCASSQAAHPCENNISAALRIPLCRPYGLTEVGYRVLVPGPDPTRAGIYPSRFPTRAINISRNHGEVIAVLGRPYEINLRGKARVTASDTAQTVFTV